MNPTRPVVKRVSWAAFASTVLVFVLFVGQAQAITASEFLNKADGWMTARDNSSFTMTGSAYQKLEAASAWTRTTNFTYYFQDNPTTGWSLRVDTTHFLCEAVYTTSKSVDTPSGRQEFFNGVCIYPDESQYGSGSLAVRSHTTLPKSCFMGNNSQTSLQALTSASSSSSVATETIYNIPCWKLTAQINITNTNALFGASYQYISAATDTATARVWINASTGEPVQSEVDLYDADLSVTSSSRVKYVVVNTSPSIPAGTFDLTGANPTATFDEAYSAWLDASGGSCY